jgi:Na+-driven multidrug efflux pump
MNTASRVAFNTFAMYAKVIITVGITLYSTRLVLDQLGAEDLGAYNLVAGIVGMLAFLQVAMRNSTQRYMSHAIGLNDKNRLQHVFCIAKRFGLLLGISLVVVIEIAGLFFFSYLNIAPDRFFAARVVFHFVVLTIFFSIISLPFDSAIVAHEDIFVISIIYAVEATLKLAVAVYLIYSPFDKLIVYGILVAGVYILSFFIKWVYCRLKYEESKRKDEKLNKSLFAEIAKFSGWSIFEPLSALFSVQGMSVILNLFAGTVINAAYGIANQVNGQLHFFSTSLWTAMNPQIMKSEGSENRARTVRLSLFTCKLSFFLLAFFSIPVLIEMPYILQLWLKNVPENTVLFCRIILICSLLSQTTGALQSGILAIGKIKKYQTAIGISKLLVLPVGFCVLKMGAPIYAAVFSFVIVEIINTIIRLQIAGKLMEFNRKHFLNHVVFRLLLSFMLAGTISASVFIFMPESFVRLIVVIVVSSISLLLLLKLLILDKDEYRQITDVLLKNILRKYFKIKERE